MYIDSETAAVLLSVSMDQVEERTLVRQLVKMDEGAWETFCREYSVPLREFVRVQFGCTRETAEDVVQMSFVRCVRSIKSFDPSRGRLFAWLKAVSKNEAHTALRELQNPPGTAARASGSRGVAPDVIADIDHALLPDEVLAQQEVQLLIYEVMVELHSRYREALVLKYLENRKVSEMAAQLGQSEKATESLLSRSREAFRRVFLKKLADSSAGEDGRTP